MKSTKVLLLSSLLLGLAVQSIAQEVLPEVVVKAVRYKYLNAVDQKDVAQPVKMLQRQAAEYDVKSADFYQEDYDYYSVSFFIPEGEILAAYDKDGKMLSTVEKYKNIALPKAVSQAVYERYPQWNIAKDVYMVNYYGDEGARKVYKMVLQKGDKRIRIKTNEKGEIL